MRNIILLTCTLLIAGFGFSQQVHDITLKISNIEKPFGDISIALFNNGDDFPGHADCYFGISLPTSSNELTYVFKDVPAGTYAVAIYHDQDKNGEMDTNWIGIPKEPYAFSNNAMGKMGPPNFDDASFEVRSNTDISIKLCK